MNTELDNNPQRFSSITREQQAFGANFLVEGKILRLDYADITHIGLVAGIMYIYTRTKKYRTEYDIAELLNRLPKDLFTRINRDFVVGISHVDQVEQYMITIGRYRLQVNYFYRTRLLAALESVEPPPRIDVTRYK